MGEAANKKIDREDAHKRVAELREEIVRKREKLSMELEELRRRRAEAMIQARNGAKVAAGAAVGLVIVGSLTRAFIDLFRKDREDAYDDRDVRVIRVEQDDHDAEKTGITSILLSTITTLIINEVRGYAMSYAREKLRTQLDKARERLEQRREATDSGESRAA